MVKHFRNLQVSGFSKLFWLIPLKKLINAILQNVQTVRNRETSKIASILVSHILWHVSQGRTKINEKCQETFLIKKFIDV